MWTSENGPFRWKVTSKLLGAWKQTEPETEHRIRRSVRKAWCLSCSNSSSIYGHELSWRLRRRRQTRSPDVLCNHGWYVHTNIFDCRNDNWLQVLELWLSFGGFMENFGHCILHSAHSSLRIFKSQDSFNTHTCEGCGDWTKRARDSEFLGLTDKPLHSKLQMNGRN